MDLEGLIEFYDARDQFSGLHNCSSQWNPATGFYRLKRSQHEEAKRIVDLFGDRELTGDYGEDTSTCLSVFGANEATCPLSMFYYGAFINDWARVRRAAAMGYVYAQSFHDDFIDSGAKHGDRVCLYKTGRVKEAAELGYHVAIDKYAHSVYSRMDPRFYKWIGRLPRSDFMYEVGIAMRHGMGRGTIMYVVGRICVAKNYVGGRENFARSVFNDWNQKSSDAVVAWILIARRLGIYRDVARLIGRLVWNARETWLE